MTAPRPRSATTRDRLTAIRQAADSAVWGGRDSAALLLLRELLEVADRHNTYRVSLNLRTLAERIGESLAPTWRAMRRLQGLGYVTKQAHRLPAQSQTYLLQAPSRSVASWNKRNP